MPQEVKNSVCLVKDLLLGSYLYFPWSRNMTISKQNVLTQLNSIPISSSLVKAVTNYIQEPDMSLVIRVELKNDRRCYDICLPKTFVQGISNILPSPSLQIRFGMDGPKYQIGGGVVTMDWTKAFGGFDADPEWSKWPLYPGSASEDKNVACDIILAWTETLKPKLQIIKMSLAPFGERLFGKEASKDLILVAGNGSEVKCHRVMFEGHSDVLAAMVDPNNRMTEAESGRVQLKENSEEGLNRLIRYLYGLELSTEDLSCDVAVELLKTAHKYNLAELMGSMIQMIWERGADWFSPDALLELYFHAKNLEEESNDWKKLVDQSLRLMLSLRFSKIQSCEVYKEISRTDPGSAKQLDEKLLELVRIYIVKWRATRN